MDVEDGDEICQPNDCEKPMATGSTGQRQFHKVWMQSNLQTLTGLELFARRELSTTYDVVGLDFTAPRNCSMNPAPELVNDITGDQNSSLHPRPALLDSVNDFPPVLRSDVFECGLRRRGFAAELEAGSPRAGHSRVQLAQIQQGGHDANAAAPDQPKPQRQPAQPPTVDGENHQRH